MNPVQQFEEYIRSGIVKKQNPNKSRAEFLVRESQRDYQAIQEIMKKNAITDENANTYIKSFHDILMQLIRAKMLQEGYNASGFGAHEAEVAYLRVLGCKESEIQFANQLRFFRNGMLYYGTMLDKEYALKVLEFLKEMYPQLVSMSKK